MDANRPLCLLHAYLRGKKNKKKCAPREERTIKRPCVVAHLLLFEQEFDSRMESKKVAPASRGFQPKHPKGAKGRHNQAKIAANKVLNGERKSARTRRRKFLRRFRKSVKKMVVERPENANGDFVGQYCADASADITGMSSFALDFLPHKAPISTINKQQGLWMQGDDGTFLCVRVPKRKADDLRRSHSKWRSTIEKAFQMKNDVARGSARNGKTDRYIIFGHRKNPLDCAVGEYAFNSQSTDKEKEDIGKEVKEMVEGIESIAMTFIHPDDLESLGALRTACALPSCSNRNFSTQFSIGRDYWSPMHVDDDFFWTILSVLDSKKDDDDSRVVHWFVFPHYGAAVPLSPGDILIFNPSVLHGCTNPSRPGSLIFSAYVSAKTVAAQAANSLV